MYICSKTKLDSTFLREKPQKKSFKQLIIKKLQKQQQQNIVVEIISSQQRV